VAASDAFIALAIALMTSAPVIGTAGGWRALPLGITAALAALLVASLGLLAFSWRGIPGGIRAALYGHAALVISIAALSGLGGVIGKMFSDRLTAAMAGFAAGVLLVAGMFLLAPLTEDTSPAVAKGLLLANPLVAVTAAAGIDLLHLDTFYRTSPLAHRGVAVPAWTTACLVYAVVGLAAFGASRIRPWSPRS
jgi:hypothetical protein